jgi:hypothetical protein
LLQSLNCVFFYIKGAGMRGAQISWLEGLVFILCITLTEIGGINP